MPEAVRYCFTRPFVGAEHLASGNPLEKGEISHTRGGDCAIRVSERGFQLALTMTNFTLPKP